MQSCDPKKRRLQVGKGWRPTPNLRIHHSVGPMGEGSQVRIFNDQAT